MKALYRNIPIRELGAGKLTQLSQDMKLSLSTEDMLAVQRLFCELGREPTDVELEVIAQTWSEHCKHRIFAATVHHTVQGKTELIHSLFDTFIRQPSMQIMAGKPDFVLSCFSDNAGFIRLDDTLALCLKAETHNHPSAIEPYAGANTGLGGVIRDILGAGKGAKPIANLDVFCFGAPDTDERETAGHHIIHPLGILRGVVHGVRDYGNRMGIPTVVGALQFDPAYIFNPLVFCGTAGVIPQKDIAKHVTPGMLVVVIGGRTGKDGLHGATFSSAAMGEASASEDQQAVQIGNPIEEKKTLDVILAARERGLLEFVTDCGAGGFSSAAGEMLSETGGELYLERAPLKEEGMESWQIFLSESQERMVAAVRPENVAELRQLATTYQTELTVLGEASGSGVLRVFHHGECVCELESERLHDAPVKQLHSVYNPPAQPVVPSPDADHLSDDLREIMSDFAIVSREPIIREYDHEVQGNTVLKPLAGAAGDAPQDGSVIAVDGSTGLMSLALSLLPEWGKYDPYAMGTGTVDETVRQLILIGTDPDKIALLDNFCMGNPENPAELGRLVECAKGMRDAALAYSAPFVSGKDSFYNYFETDAGPVNIPVTFLCTGFGVVEDASHVCGATLRNRDSAVFLVGYTEEELGGSVYARRRGITTAKVPQTQCADNFRTYKQYYRRALTQGLVSAAHDLSEGGLAVAAAEMCFSGLAGLEIALDALPTRGGWTSAVTPCFAESTGRFLVEVNSCDVEKFTEAMAGCPCACVGRAAECDELRFTLAGKVVLSAKVSELKKIWKTGLKKYY